MTIQPVKAFASFVDKTGSKTIDLCKSAKSRADQMNTSVKTFAKNQADKFVATKPAQFIGKNKNIIVGAAVLTAGVALAVAAAKAIIDKVQEIRNK
ncbi:MAG: hypothetical protein IKL52_05740 [Candidatus Gastranaerophilales bacterium]|nr:hypothetical protein [Candidatus Gastranaerophilales bacterium]